MENIKHNAIKYPSTEQFRNVIRAIADWVRHKGKDEDGNAIYDRSKELPVVEYVGTVKLHGTCASLVMFEDGKIYCQSKERMLAFGCDNAGFWEAMQGVDLESLFDFVKKRYYEMNGCNAPFPIVIAGEWVGGNIQKGVAINGLHKFFAIFGVKCGEEWQPQEEYAELKDTENYIFNIMQFETFNVTIDFNHPEQIQNKLIELTEKVEEECPVGVFFGVSKANGSPCTVGEGIVWKPKDPELCKHHSLCFKVKGEKHSSSKVKKLASVDTEKLESIQEFVKYVATESRLEQGIQEVGLDIKNVGAYIGWVNKDVIKEESDTLRDNNLEMKDVGRAISDVARKFYLKKINEQF